MTNPRESVEREHDERRRTRAPEETGDDTRGRRHVLLAADLVRHDTSANASAGVEFVQRVPVARVDDEKVVVESAGEEDAAGCCRDRGDEWRRPVLLPAHLAGRAVDRGE